MAPYSSSWIEAAQGWRYRIRRTNCSKDAGSKYRGGAMSAIAKLLAQKERLLERLESDADAHPVEQVAPAGIALGRALGSAREVGGRLEEVAVSFDPPISDDARHI